MSIPTPPNPRTPIAEPMLSSERIGPAGLAFLLGLVIAWFVQVV